MPEMIDPLGDSLAALESAYNPASPGIVRTQSVDARLNAIKAAASFSPVSQIVDPIGTDLNLLGGSGFDVTLDFLTQTFKSRTTLGTFAASAIFSTSRSQNVYAPWADGHWQLFAPGTLPITDLGIFAFIATNNALLQSSTPAAASWTKTSMTAVNANRTGPDNIANSAATITATADGGTISQAVTAVSSVQTGSVFLMPVTLTGKVWLSLDGGSTQTEITARLAAAGAASFKWTPCAVKNQTLANPTFWLKFEKSGDSLGFKWAMLEALPDTTSPIETTTGAGVRNNDVIRLLDPLKSLIQAAAKLSIFLEVDSAAQNHPTPNWLYLSAAVTPGSNNIVLKPHQDGGVWFIVTNGNGHSQSQHIGTLVKNEEIQRHASSLDLNSQPFVTTCGQGAGADSYYRPQSFTSTVDTLPNLIGGDIVIGGTTSGGTMANRPLRKVLFKFATSTVRSLQDWVTGATDVFLDNKSLFDSTITSGSTTFPGFGVNLNHRTNILTKAIPDSANLRLINALGASYVRIGWTWAEIEVQQVSGSATFNTTGGGQMVVTGTPAGQEWAIGQCIADINGGGTPVTPGTKITDQVSGTPGGDGTYSVSISQTIASARPITGTIFDWSQCNSLVQQLTAAGKKIIWVLGSYHPNYGINFGSLPQTTFQYNALTNYGVNLVNQLASLGIDMSKITIEGLNETNLTPNMPAANLAGFTNICFAAIHVAQPSVQCISGGLGVGSSGSNLPNTYIAAYKAAQSGFISGYGDHPYNSGAAGNPEQMIAQLASFAAAAGVSASQIFATEQAPAFDWVEYNEDYLRARVTRSVLAALSAGPAVSCHYDAICDGPDRTVHEAGFGLADYNYNLLPSGQAFANLMALFASATSWDQIDSSTWTRIIALHQASGGTKRIVWNTHFPPINIRRTVDVGDLTGLTVKDLLGNNVPYALSGTKVTVLLQEAVGPLVISAAA